MAAAIETTIGVFRYGAYLDPENSAWLRTIEILFTDFAVYAIESWPDIKMPQDRSVGELIMENVTDAVGFREWAMLKEKVPPTVDYVNIEMTKELKKDGDIIFQMKNKDVKKVTMYRDRHFTKGDCVVELSGNFMGLNRSRFYIPESAVRQMVQLINITPLATRLEVKL